MSYYSTSTTQQAQNETPASKFHVEEDTMIDRRELLTLGGLFGTLAGRGENADAAALGTADVSDRSVQDVVSALKSITSAVYAAQSFDAIRPIRTKQIDWLKATNKFPDF